MPDLQNYRSYPATIPAQLSVSQTGLRQGRYTAHDQGIL